MIFKYTIAAFAAASLSTVHSVPVLAASCTASKHSATSTAQTVPSSAHPAPAIASTSVKLIGSSIDAVTQSPAYTVLHKRAPGFFSRRTRRKKEFELAPYQPSDPRPRFLPEYENFALKGEYELAGGDNKMAEMLQDLADKQARGMKGQKAILKDYRMLNFNNMWKTTVIASGEGYQLDRDVEEFYISNGYNGYDKFYDPQGVKVLNKAILYAPHYNAPLTVYHYMDCDNTQEFSVGTTVPMDRFMSTSSSSEIGMHVWILTRIDLPKEFPALVIKYAKHDTTKGEREVLLPFTLDTTGNSLTYCVSASC
jgi:hypothetical protein